MMLESTVGLVAVMYAPTVCQPWCRVMPARSLCSSCHLSRSSVYVAQLLPCLVLSLRRQAGKSNPIGVIMKTLLSSL